jgi:hypothetical protein
LNSRSCVLRPSTTVHRQRRKTSSHHRSSSFPNIVHSSPKTFSMQPIRSHSQVCLRGWSNHYPSWAMYVHSIARSTSRRVVRRQEVNLLSNTNPNCEKENTNLFKVTIIIQAPHHTCTECIHTCTRIRVHTHTHTHAYTYTNTRPTPATTVPPTIQALTLAAQYQ